MTNLTEVLILESSILYATMVFEKKYFINLFATSFRRNFCWKLTSYPVFMFSKLAPPPKALTLKLYLLSCVIFSELSSILGVSVRCYMFNLIILGSFQDKAEIIQQKENK